MTTKAMMKRKPIICRCKAEKYPHRLDSTQACRDLYDNEEAVGERPVVSYTNDYFARMFEFGLKESDFR